MGQRVKEKAQMFETGIRQFRMALGMVWGRKLDTGNLARLVNDALATIAEFGEPGADVRELIDGPFADPQARREFADRALRRTARRLADRSPFYARRFQAAEVDLDKFDQDTLRTIPVTVKRDLIDRQADFQCSDVTPYLSTRTTGTTGKPAEIWMSRYELELWAGLSALTGVLRDEIRTTDLMQVNASSRATAAVHLTSAICRLAGARCRVLGIIPPDEALDNLVDGGVTLLAAPPSYLAELVMVARRRGTSPSDFRLRRIDAGGELLTSTLRQAVQQTFGNPRVNDVFAMTEIIPVSAGTCTQGHLHHDINTGLVEVLDLETGAPAGPGEPGTVVVTPYYPYRECMPMFRYDTRDVVYRLPDAELTCEVAGLPATSAIVGKADQLLRLGDELVTPRALAEAVEALPSEPWPARFRAQLVGGRLQLSLPMAAMTGLSESAVLDHFAARGLDVQLTVVADDQAILLRPLRSDLHETTFVGRPA
jgi:phenylacetate-coenzyme A ligase PaaK-like adenylate-forming protein